MPMLQMMGDAGRDMVNARGCGGDERHDFNVNDTATLEPVGCGMKRQPATNDNKVAKDGGEALSKRSAKAKQEREKGFKPSQYKTRMCRRWNEMTPGKCDKGETCWFAHGEDDLSTLENPIHVPSCVFKQIEESEIKIIQDSSDVYDSSADDDQSFGQLQKQPSRSSASTDDARPSSRCEPCSEMHVPRTVRQNVVVSPERQPSITSSIDSEPYSPVSRMPPLPPLPPLNLSSFAGSPTPFTQTPYECTAAPAQLGGGTSPPSPPKTLPFWFAPSPAEPTTPSIPSPRPPPAAAWNVARRALFPEAAPVDTSTQFAKQAWPDSNLSCATAVPLRYGPQTTGSDPVERKIPSWPCRVPIATAPVRSKFDTMWDVPTKAEVEPTNIELAPSGCGAQIDRAWAWDGSKLFANPNLPVDLAPLRVETEAAWPAEPHCYLESKHHQEQHQHQFQELIRQQCLRDLCEAQLRHTQLCNLFAALQ